MMKRLIALLLVLLLWGYSFLASALPSPGLIKSVPKPPVPRQSIDESLTKAIEKSIEDTIKKITSATSRITVEVSAKKATGEEARKIAEEEGASSNKAIIELPYGIHYGMTIEEANRCMEQAGFVSKSYENKNDLKYEHYYKSAIVYGLEARFTTLSVYANGAIDISYFFRDNGTRQYPGEIFMGILSMLNDKYSHYDYLEGPSYCWNNEDARLSILLCYYGDNAFSLSYAHWPDGEDEMRYVPII